MPIKNNRWYARWFIAPVSLSTASGPFSLFFMNISWGFHSHSFSIGMCHHSSTRCVSATRSFAHSITWLIYRRIEEGSPCIDVRQSISIAEVLCICMRLYLFSPSLFPVQLHSISSSFDSSIDESIGIEHKSPLRSSYAQESFVCQWLVEQHMPAFNTFYHSSSSAKWTCETNQQNSFTILYNVHCLSIYRWHSFLLSLNVGRSLNLM